MNTRRPREAKGVGLAALDRPDEADPNGVSMTRRPPHWDAACYVIASRHSVGSASRTHLTGGRSRRAFTIANDRVVEVDLIADPKKLGLVESLDVVRMRSAPAARPQP